MSRSRNVDKPVNPTEMFLRWSSDAKSWTFFKKDDDGGHNVVLDIKTPFIVLDVLNTVGGFDEKENSGIWSNEVRTTKDQLAVHAGKKLLATGPWEVVKGQTDAKFAQSVYVMAKVDNEYVLANLKLTGAALSSWFDFVKEIGGRSSLYGDVVISVVGVEDKKKGRTEYSQPTFGIVSRTLTGEASAMASEMDTKLQAYLDIYLTERTSPAFDEEQPVADELPL